MPVTVRLADGPIGTSGSIDTQSRSRRRPTASTIRREALELGRREEHVDVGVDDVHERSGRDRVEDLRAAARRRHRAARGPGCRARPGPPRQSASRRRSPGARRPPASRGRSGSARSSGSTSIPTRSATVGSSAGRRGVIAPGELDVERDRRAARADVQRLAARRAVRVPVTVEMQREPGAGPDVDEHDIAALVRRLGQRRDEVRAPADLVHLVAVTGAELEQLVGVLEAEGAVVRRELRSEERLRLAEPWEPAAQRLGLERQDQRGRGGREQQRRQAVGGDRRRRARSSSSSSRRTANCAAVSRHDGGEPGADQAVATISACSAIRRASVTSGSGQWPG